ncbi:hypothetical protein [Verrucomicrobium spinosum]|uniref:hypothetical protein n=1 Tax=Verrucomicrobium spinosum TaxID=2736 RepID=UPI0009463AF9|nr:hypothetical protein [Verrucomicrobium spinosum]
MSPAFGWEGSIAWGKPSRNWMVYGGLERVTMGRGKGGGTNARGATAAQVIVWDIGGDDGADFQDAPCPLNEAGLSALKYLSVSETWGAAPGWDEAGPLALSFCCIDVL